MRRKDVEDCEYLTIYLFINKVHYGLKMCNFIFLKKSKVSIIYFKKIENL